MSQGLHPDESRSKALVSRETYFTKQNFQVKQGLQKEILQGFKKEEESYDEEISKRIAKRNGRDHRNLVATQQGEDSTEACDSAKRSPAVERRHATQCSAGGKEACEELT